MSTPARDSYTHSEVDIQKAISAYEAKEYISIRATARVFNVPLATLFIDFKSTYKELQLPCSHFSMTSAIYLLLPEFASISMAYFISKQGHHLHLFDAQLPLDDGHIENIASSTLM